MGDQHICSRDKEIERLVKENDMQFEDLKTKVSWGMYWAINLVIFGILGTTMSNIYSQIDEHEDLVNRKIEEVQRDNKNSDIMQAKIETQLLEIQKQLTDINSKISAKQISVK